MRGLHTIAVRIVEPINDKTIILKAFSIFITGSKKTSIFKYASIAKFVSVMNYAITRFWPGSIGAGLGAVNRPPL